MPYPFQIRAARAMLGWSQTELAERANVGFSSIADCESERREVSPKTIEKMVAAFEQEAVYITENGVERRTSSTYTINGENWWLRVLDDVYYELAGKPDSEWLLMFADDRKSPKSVNEKIRSMRKAGLRMRQLVEEGNRFLMGQVEEYRWIPKAYFQNNVTLIYGQKVAVCAEDNTKAVIFRDRSLADSWRKAFEMLWNGVTALQPDRSNADERF